MLMSCGEHFTIYINIKSLHGIPETNKMWYVNYTLIKRKKINHYSGHLRILFTTKRERKRKWVTDAFHTNLVETLDLSLDLGRGPCSLPHPLHGENSGKPRGHDHRELVTPSLILPMLWDHSVASNSFPTSVPKRSLPQVGPLVGGLDTAVCTPRSEKGWVLADGAVTLEHGPMSLFSETFNLEIMAESHTVVRHNRERSQVPFTQSLPAVTSYKTIAQYYNQDADINTAHVLYLDLPFYSY